MTSAPRAPKGARLLMIAQLGKAAALFIGIVVVSRLLEPWEIGYVVVPLAILGIGDIIRDFGLSTAATTTPWLTPAQRDVLFWVNVLVSVLLAAIVVLGAPLLADLFNSDAISETLPWLAVVFLVNGIGTQYRADLNRTMRFRALALVDSAAALLGVVATVVLAIVGASYWALVAQPIAVAVVATTMCIILCRWMPGLPTKAPGVGRLLAFGANVGWSQVLIYAGNNVDVLALGLHVNSTQLGLYQRGYEVSNRPFTLLKAPATSVALPMMAGRAGNRRAFTDAAVKGQSLLTFTVVAGAVFLAACADPAVRVMLGEAWVSAIPVVSLLALGSAFQQVAAVAGWMFMAGGHGASLRRYSTVSLIIKVAAVVATAPWGIEAVAAAYAVSALLSAPLAIWWASKVSGASTGRLFIAQFPALVTVALAGVVTWVVVQIAQAAPPVVQLIFGVVVFGAAIAAAACVPAVRRDLRIVAGVLLRRSAQ